MKKWRQELTTVGAVICICGSIILTGKDGNSFVQELAGKTFFPGIQYEESEEMNINDLISKKASHLIPLTGYLSEESYYETKVQDEMTYEMLMKLQENDEENETAILNPVIPVQKVDVSVEKLKDFDYLISKFYTVDSVTYVKESDFPVEEMLSMDFTINKEGEGPKILIFHTHSQEAFADSTGAESDTIVGVGDYLTRILNENYGIQTLHYKGVYDKVNGYVDRSQAYERAKPEIKKVLKENPSIEVVIDLHRDGVGASTHLVTKVNEKQTAQIMFFNGMCRTRTNGDLTGIGNPYLKENLAFSLQMKIAAEEMYPGFSRRNYLKGYRYNMDLMPKMLLIEAGAQTNTVEEVMNAMEPLAAILNDVLTY